MTSQKPRRWMGFPAVRAGFKLATLNRGGRRLGFVKTTLFTSAGGVATVDVPYTTQTGNILLRAVFGDSSSAVDTPYVITYDLAGANVVLTQHKVIAGPETGEASGRARLLLASVKGLPITNVAKLVRIATAGGLNSGWNVVIADLPSWWSGAIGAVDASGAHVTKNSHTSPAIVTLAKNSLLAACAGCVDGTLGTLVVSGQGAPWKLDMAQTKSGFTTLGYNGMFASKLMGRAGVTADFGLATLSAANSADWAAGLVEIRP